MEGGDEKQREERKEERKPPILYLIIQFPDSANDLSLQILP